MNTSTLAVNLYYKLINGIAVPGGMLHHWSTKLVVFLTNQLNSPNPNSPSPLYGWGGATRLDLARLDRPKPTTNKIKDSNNKTDSDWNN